MSNVGISPLDQLHPALRNKQKHQKKVQHREAQASRQGKCHNQLGLVLMMYSLITQAIKKKRELKFISMVSFRCLAN